MIWWSFFLFTIYCILGTDAMAWRVKCLPHKSEDLGSISISTSTLNNNNTTKFNCDLSTGEVGDPDQWALCSVSDSVSTIKMGGRWGGSMGKGTCCQTWVWSYDPHGRRREPTSKTVLWSLWPTAWCVFLPAKNKCNDLKRCKGESECGRYLLLTSGFHKCEHTHIHTIACACV